MRSRSHWPRMLAKGRMTAMGLSLVFSMAGVGGCFNFSDDDQCFSDDDCSDRDDPCFGPGFCDMDALQCRNAFLLDDEACACGVPADCERFGMRESGCSRVRCSTSHQCSQEIVPAGPALDDEAGDCERRTCDGESPVPIVQVDDGDIPDDDNACTVDTCESHGPANVEVPSGTNCSGGVCLQGSCSAGCSVQNPEACGDEGPGEPEDDDVSGASEVDDGVQTCGMLDADDVDWFRFEFIDDHSDVALLYADVVSSAPDTQTCMYARCTSGGAAGGEMHGGDCGIEGPMGSVGCCWIGDDHLVDRLWWLDCSDSVDDSATLFVSVRAPGADACESYSLTAGTW